MSEFKKMKCGGCGCDTVTLRAKQTAPCTSFSFEAIEITCMECKDITLLEIAQPEIRANWGEKSEGIFCTGWQEEN